LKIDLDDGNESKKTGALETVKNGYFYANFSVDKDKKAGKYLVHVEAYQKDASEVTTNTGFIDYTIEIGQVAKNLEIILENTEVEPGTNLIAKAILHDQTGENIASGVKVTLRDSKGKLVEQADIYTDEFFEFSIAKDELPLTWEVTFETSDFSNSMNFDILEKPDVKLALQINCYNY